MTLISAEAIAGANVRRLRESSAPHRIKIVSPGFLPTLRTNSLYTSSFRLRISFLSWSDCSLFKTPRRTVNFKGDIGIGAGTIGHNKTAPNNGSGIFSLP